MKIVFVVQRYGLEINGGKQDLMICLLILIKERDLQISGKSIIMSLFYY